MLRVLPPVNETCKMYRLCRKKRNCSLLSATTRNLEQPDSRKIYSTRSSCAKQVARFCCPFYRSSGNWTGRAITHAVNRFSYISHNTTCLLSKILHNFCLELLRGISVVPREIEDNAFEKFGGQTRCIMGDLQMATLWMAFFTSSKNTLGRPCVLKKTKVEIITNYCLKFCFSYDSCINKQVGILLHGHPIFFS